MKFRTDFLNSKQLPELIEPEKSVTEINSRALIDICLENRDFLQKELLKYGALLFRGFNIKTPPEFEQFVRAFSGKNLLDYAGGVSPRFELTGGGVYTSTEYPANFTLSLHNELSYSHNYPSEVYFCCLIAPKEAGETPIGNSRTILKNIAPEIVEEFKRKKIKYIRNLPGDKDSGYAWQDAFETDDKLAVENYCREAGIEFEWKSCGLKLSQICPATVVHPETGEEVWFNQAEGFHPSNVEPENYLNMSEEDFRLNSRFGDDSPLDIAQLNHIREVTFSEMTIFPWQEGDCLVLDNLLTAHGRMPFSGQRKIILAMT